MRRRRQARHSSVTSKARRVTEPTPGSHGAPSEKAEPASDQILIDGHLDLAFNEITKGRDLTLPLDVLRRREGLEAKEAMVTLPELQRGGLDVVIATLFVLPSAYADRPGPKTYDDETEAEALAWEQLALYERWEDERRVRILRTCADLDAHLAAPHEDRPLGLVVSMEGAAPIREPAALGAWVARGVRIVGPAWKSNRYVGGTGEPGGLSTAGEELIDAMTHHGVALDVSHLAEDAFWQAIERHQGPVLASHSNARALVDTERQLSDAMSKALAARDGIVGLVLADKFLRPGGNRALRPGGTPVGLDDVSRHAEHVAGCIGWERLAVGSDLDGGFGRQETPAEIDRGSDFRRVGESVPQHARRSFLGDAWLGTLRRTLPRNA